MQLSRFNFFIEEIFGNSVQFLVGHDSTKKISNEKINLSMQKKVLINQYKMYKIYKNFFPDNLYLQSN